MAQTVTVRLQRESEGQPLGFRLHGGKDFGTPLLVQKVMTGGVAERGGLRAGDAVISVNGRDVYALTHQQAQDTIRGVRAPEPLVLSVQRGPSTIWKPTVTPMGPLSRPTSTGPVSPHPVTQTSLKATPNVQRIPNAHNTTAKPFALANGGGLVNKQYNSPMGMYSEQNIAETLAAQSEVLAGGVLGVNFKKNEKTYDAEKSEVYKMLLQEESDPERMPERNGTGGTSPGGGGGVAGLRHVAPPAPSAAPATPCPTGGLPIGQNVCEECERLITGVFVRVRDRNLHVECFKCATCGSSLKNQGYYCVNEKLYCDIHARLVAKHAPPAPGLEPVTVPPQLSPAHMPAPAYVPAHPPTYTPPSSTLRSPHLVSGVSAVSGPRPFSGAGAGMGAGYNSVAAPLSPRPAAATLYAPPPPPSAALPPHTSPRPGKAFGVSVAPRRGRGILNKAAGPGVRVPLCAHCNNNIRGPFITALGRIWCPEHFVCARAGCGRALQEIGFVEEGGRLHCEYCFEAYLAPACDKCHGKVKGDCLNALGKHFHPECFACAYCGKLFHNNPFFLEDGLPYCEADWNELFTTKCFACGFPVEAGDRWVEALNNNYHSQCFNCTMCKKNLEGQSFFAKGGRPFCKAHAR